MTESIKMKVYIYIYVLFLRLAPNLLHVYVCQIANDLKALFFGVQVRIGGEDK